MRSRLAALVTSITLLATSSASAATCEPGRWLLPSDGGSPNFEAMLASIEPGAILLLGETHDNVHHHRWQASLLSGLLARDVPVALGLEAFPRRVQPVLDRWSAGGLSELEFRREVEWDRIWGFEWRLYAPLLELAALHRLSLVALNVERSLVSKVGEVGWAALPAEEREGLGDPAPPQDAYREVLADVLEEHLPEDEEKGGDEAVDEAAFDERLDRFVDAQLTWDRAMAEALASAAGDEHVTIGIAGSGHLRHGHGIAHQLRDLGREHVVTWLPLDAADPCPEVDPKLADAVAWLPPPDIHAAGSSPPRLGVLMESSERGLVVTGVLDGSVAGAAGITTGDILLSAAGLQLAETSDLSAIIRRQAPGTWLPLVVERDGVLLPVVAEFPPPEVPKREPSAEEGKLHGG